MRRREYGSSLLEVLVVIVVFGVGILGVVQIFPKALDILRSTREGAVAESLAHQKLQQIKFQKWQWVGLPTDQLKKGFSFEPGKKKFTLLDWRKYLSPQAQNRVVETLRPNKEGLIFCSAGPIEDTVQITELQKVDQESDLSSNNYYEPEDTKGLGVYKVSQDRLKEPLQIEYNVRDWRILSEDFLGIKDSQYQLTGQSIKRNKDLERDNQIYSGCWKNKDIVLINLLDGTLINKNFYDVDYSIGTITTKSNFPHEKPVRIYYQKKGEWYLQVLRAEEDPHRKGSKEKWIVRVYWNPHYFRLRGDDEAKINAINKWTDQYKMIELEAF